MRLIDFFKKEKKQHEIAINTILTDNELRIQTQQTKTRNENDHISISDNVQADY